MNKLQERLNEIKAEYNRNNWNVNNGNISYEQYEEIQKKLYNEYIEIKSKLK